MCDKDDYCKENSLICVFLWQQFAAAFKFFFVIGSQRQQVNRKQSQLKTLYVNSGALDFHQILYVYFLFNFFALIIS